MVSRLRYGIVGTLAVAVGQAAGLSAREGRPVEISELSVS